MFNPDKLKDQQALKKAKKLKIKQLKQWAAEVIPLDKQEGLNINIEEIQCGDPNCSPIDTVVTLIWNSGGKGMFGIPAEVDDVNREDLIQFFPDSETLALWAEGKEAQWPKLPDLRFEVGHKVECRVGPHPVNDWAPGAVIAHYYSEPHWPPGNFAPYQVELEDGRLIFAPMDIDEVIRSANSATS